jgi:hypothetical protein
MEVRSKPVVEELGAKLKVNCVFIFHLRRKSTLIEHIFEIGKVGILKNRKVTHLQYVQPCVGATRVKG